MPHELLPMSMVQNKKRLTEHTRKLLSRRELRKQVNGRFDYNVSNVGKTQDGRVEVWYDPALGSGGLALAQVLLSQIQTVMEVNDNFFEVKGLAGNLLLVSLSGQSDGSGGAYHYGCAFDAAQTGASDWYIDYATFSNGMDLGLAQAEVSESYMGLQGKGWDCGGSNGEGLSRVLAEQMCGGPMGALSDFQTFPSWQEADSPNWIDQTEPTDQNPVSTGCAVGYLYWMQSLGYTWGQIIQAGCPDGTLASNYKALTGKEGGWDAFMLAVNQLKGEIVTDNPWPSAPKPAPGVTVTAAVAKAVVPDLFARIQSGLNELRDIVASDRAKLVGADDWQLLHQLDNMLKDKLADKPPAK